MPGSVLDTTCRRLDAPKVPTTSIVASAKGFRIVGVSS